MITTKARMGFVRGIGEINISYQYGDEFLLGFIVQQSAMNYGRNGCLSGRHPECMHKLMKQGFVWKNSAGLVFMILQIFGTGASFRKSFWPEMHHGFNHSACFGSNIRDRGAVTVALRIGTNLQNTMCQVSGIVAYVIGNALQQKPAHIGAFYLNQGIQRSRLVLVSGPSKQIDSDPIFLFKIV